MNLLIRKNTYFNLFSNQTIEDFYFINYVYSINKKDMNINKKIIFNNNIEKTYFSIILDNNDYLNLTVLATNRSFQECQLKNCETFKNQFHQNLNSRISNYYNKTNNVYSKFPSSQFEHQDTHKLSKIDINHLFESRPENALY